MKVSVGHSTNQSVRYLTVYLIHLSQLAYRYPNPHIKMRKDMYVSTFPGHLKQVGLGLVLFPIYSKMHYGFSYVGEQASPPQHTTHTKLRHGKRHDTANNTVTHIVGLLGRI